MLSYFNSRERERDDWKRICQEVDKRFRFVDTWVPEGSALGIIEAVWEDEVVDEVGGDKGAKILYRVGETNGDRELHGIKETNEVEK